MNFRQVLVTGEGFGVWSLPLKTRKYKFFAYLDRFIDGFQIAVLDAKPRTK